jgi:cation diffusion facilitator family transporter
MRSSSQAASRRSIAVAMAADVVVASAKLGAGLLSGSSALLAEAVHSAADSVNELVLALSMSVARRPADPDHPFGYRRARFLGGFLAAISFFLVGGCLSIGLAVITLVHGETLDHFVVAWIVLVVAAVADGAALAQTLGQARREAALWDLSTIGYLRQTSEPTLRALAVEDTAALAGVLIAATGLLVHELGGPSTSDSIASLLIGILLAVTAIGLARPLAELLIGRSIAPGRLKRARAILEDTPNVAQVLDLYAVYVAPQEAILAAKVHPTNGQTGEELAEVLDQLDQRLRTELPEIAEVFIDLTANSRTTREPT